MEQAVVGQYLQWGVLGATCILLAGIAFTLWRALLASNAKNVELMEKSIVCMERISDSVDALSKTHSESMRALAERIDVGGQITKLTAELAARREAAR